MSHTFVNPTELHDSTEFGYSQSAVVPAGGLVLFAGQYGCGNDGKVISPNFAEQTHRAVQNLGVALAASGLNFDNVARIGTYIVDHNEEKLGVLLNLVHQTWGDQPPAQTVLGVSALALPEMRFVIDAVAVRPTP